MATESLQHQGIGEKTLIRVESRSRPGLFHWVDVDRDFCSCEAASFGNYCHHLEDAKCAWCLGYGTFISYPKLMTCSHCGGSGRAS